MIAVDTNVLIYACDQSEPHRQTIALNLIAASTDGILLSTQRRREVTGSPAVVLDGFTRRSADETRFGVHMLLACQELHDRWRRDRQSVSSAGRAALAPSHDGGETPPSQPPGRQRSTRWRWARWIWGAGFPSLPARRLQAGGLVDQHRSGSKERG
jgi:hypothetical protein